MLISRERQRGRRTEGSFASAMSRRWAEGFLKKKAAAAFGQSRPDWSACIRYASETRLVKWTNTFRCVLEPFQSYLSYGSI